MKPIPVTFWNLRADIPNGISSETFFLTLTDAVSLQLWGGEHRMIDTPWDLLIAHPPCTYLTVTANSWYDVGKYGEKAKQRYNDRYKAIVFFMYFACADCKKIAIENPVGIMNTAYRKPDCIIHPYFFGDDAKKKTCFWLKNLPPLKATNPIAPTTVVTGKKTDSPWHADSWKLPPDERSRERSKTFLSVAHAMATQWGGEA